jgi:lipopolysaccharide/colanic/teichoic acid biosynthesis glycosyltransferase
MILPTDRILATSRPLPSGAPHARSKRVIDFVLASGGLTLLLPLFAVIAAAIKLDTRGPVFYTQERVA